MALFGKLFEKKICSICGGEIGLLGNRKLADGNCCKKCAAKLSPWFTDRREATVAEIQEQLAYRDRNAEALQSFNVTSVIGENEKMYIEEIDGIPTRFFVTSCTSYLEENPDIISFTDVLSCTVDIDENKEEIMRENKDGENVSFNPPRFQHHYNFYIDMVIRNVPWFDSIRFNVNDEDVTLETVGMGSSPLLRSPMGRNPAVNREADRYRTYEQMCKKIVQTVEDGKNGASLQAAAAAAEPELPAFCPACGAPTGGNRFCPFCGTKLG